jgi:hypothetical protein
MSGVKSPLQVVNEQFGGKEKLVDRLAGLVQRGEEQADDVKARLRTASNKKLLHLHKVSESVKASYGSTDKLAATVAELLGRAKDSDYVKKLGSFSPARLLDMAQSLGKRAKAAGAKAATAAKAAAKAKPAKSASPKAKTTKTASAKKPAAKAKKQ